MKEPRYEYHFTQPYYRDWSQLYYSPGKVGRRPYLQSGMGKLLLERNLVTVTVTFRQGTSQL